MTMSNKRWTQLLDADRMIRKLSPNKGMTNGVELQIRIELKRGFELFNTRPYHNFEDWADGYFVSAYRDGKVIAEAEREDLDDALEALSLELMKERL